MADLTPQAKDSYKKLRKAATDLKTAFGPLSADGNPTLIKNLFLALEGQLPASLNTIDELEINLARADSYLVAQEFLLDTSSLNVGQKKAIAQATQELLHQSALLKASLKDIEDVDLSTLESLKPPYLDALFFDFLPKDLQGNPKEEEGWTEKLLDGSLSALNDGQVQQLTDAWGTAISTFVENSRKRNEPKAKLQPGKPDTIVHFFCIHEELEVLYDRLSTLIA
jgi:hypothetical protein